MPETLFSSLTGHIPRYYTYTNIMLSPGADRIHLEGLSVIRSGLLGLFYLETDNPDVLVEIDLDGDNSMEYRFSPRKLHDDGLLCPQLLALPCISRYDDPSLATRRYVVTINPLPCGVPISPMFSLYLSNPSSTNATIHVLRVWVFERVE